VRAWKWRQLLFPIRSIGTAPLFGTIMAGYLLGMLVPFGFGTVARSWLVARRENLKMSAVLATVAIDRLTDGIVFALLVPVALALVSFPDPTGDIHAGLSWGAMGSLLFFALLLLALAAYKRGVVRADGRVARFVDRLPPRFGAPVRRLYASFAEGIVWPSAFWRGAGIVLASVVIKLFAATHFLWAGLVVGVALRPGQYLFLLVFLGFLVILGHFARIAGSFVIGAVFALRLFGVGEEQALAMVLVVEAANLLSVAGVGAFALWRQGVALADLRTVGADNAARRG
jgi:glycosyltransferase 2 family protein